MTSVRHGRQRTTRTDAAEQGGTPRRRFLGYLIAGPTLAVAASLASDLLVDGDPAGAVVKSLPEVSDIEDLGALLTTAAMPTASLITIVVNTDGTASFALPRAEVGQGITTAAAMLISEELDLDVSKIHVTLADARPELLFNQLTGGSNSVRSLFHPVRVAAALAREQLIEAEAKQWKVRKAAITTHDGTVSAPGHTATYGQLATAAAATKTTSASVTLKKSSDFTVIGTARNHIDSLASVTGTKTFTMDMQVPNALPTMVCRPPTIKGTVVSVANLAAVQAMPGVTDVAVVSTGVAVRAATFGQCIDAVRALTVTWGPGSEDGKDDASILAQLKHAEVPLLVPKVSKGAHTIDADFTYYFRSNSPLETNCAIADVRAHSAEVWSPLKSPIVAQGHIADLLNLPVDAVTVHVTPGGGSFGRHLFWDAAIEAAEISKAMGKPVKLMWHRTDDFRHGRTHPMATSRIRATWSGKNVLTFEQRHTSILTDFSHGLGDVLTAYSATLPVGKLGFSETVFELTQNVPYNFGITDQILNEVDGGFHTGSMRNIYSPDVTTAKELVVDMLAEAMGQDRYQFRHTFLKDARSRAVMDKAAQVGNWGRTMPAGTAQGIAFHQEYIGVAACLVEIDCRPATVNRPIADGVTGPLVTKVVYVVDVGLPINPRGLEAQMLGGIMDGIAQALTSSLHFSNGLPLEGSWDNYFYTRQWNVPPDVTVVVMPPTTGKPGGAGEFGVAASMAAVACAYTKATGTLPTAFPINHDGPLAFTPLPTVPSIPQSPVDGLSNAF
jgi:isoquinoline 1-oxidoreductase beta subunit